MKNVWNIIMKLGMLSVLILHNVKNIKFMIFVYYNQRKKLKEKL